MLEYINKIELHKYTRTYEGVYTYINYDNQWTIPRTTDWKLCYPLYYSIKSLSFFQKSCIHKYAKTLFSSVRFSSPYSKFLKVRLKLKFWKWFRLSKQRWGLYVNLSHCDNEIFHPISQKTQICHIYINLHIPRCEIRPWFISFLKQRFTFYLHFLGHVIVRVMWPRDGKFSYSMFLKPASVKMSFYNIIY